MTAAEVAAVEARVAQEFRERLLFDPVVRERLGITLIPAKLLSPIKEESDDGR